MEATSRRVHTWCSVHVEQHSGEGVLALVLLWLGSRLDWASLNFSYLIFKLEHTQHLSIRAAVWPENFL